MWVAMSAAKWFFEDVIDDAELLEMRRSESERVGRFRRVFVTLPKNAGTAFGANHGIIGILQNRDSVPYSDSECSA